MLVCAIIIQEIQLFEAFSPRFQATKYDSSSYLIHYARPLNVVKIFAFQAPVTTPP